MFVEWKKIFSVYQNGNQLLTANNCKTLRYNEKIICPKMSVKLFYIEWTSFCPALDNSFIPKKKYVDIIIKVNHKSTKHLHVVMLSDENDQLTLDLYIFLCLYVYLNGWNCNEINVPCYIIRILFRLLLNYFIDMNWNRCLS